MKHPARVIYQIFFFLTVSLSLAFTATSCQVVSIVPSDSQPAATSALDTTLITDIFGDMYEDELVLGRSGPPFPLEPSNVEPSVPTTETTAVETSAETTAESTTTSTIAPAAAPTAVPSAVPTAKPTPKPTAKPTAVPTPKPTAVPTAVPTPIPAPTTAPTPAPTPNPLLCIVNLPGVPSNPLPYSASQQAKIDSFVALVNEARATAGVSALAVGNSSLQQMAAIRAAEVSVLFSHNRPTEDINSKTWSDLLFGLNISFRSAAENITGIDHVSGATTYISAFNAFWNSDGHKRNMLNPDYNKISIGIYTDSNGKDWYTQEFVKD